MSTLIKTKEDLDSRKSAYRESLRKYKYKVLVCGGAGCLSSNCAEVQAALKECLKKNHLEEDVCLLETGCIGSCAVGPLIIIEPEGILYTNVTPSMAWEILESHIISGHVIEEYTFYDLALNKNVARKDDITFFKEQTKIALKNCGTIDHGSIDAYIAANGYQAICKVLQGSREDVVRVVKESGLRGRGGGGFPTGVKWEAAFKVESDQKYMVCNADEGDPGAFMDRSLLEGDPHGIIEGMMIGGYAIGANMGYVYVRAEYPLAVERLGRAIDQARQVGLLGKGILGSNFDFDVEIRIGAGAFVCGEETALMFSIEGKRGEPSQKPPFPFEKGLYGQPTIINNVETFANISTIIRKGADYFRQFGTPSSPGTKVFALAGNINNNGIIEVPMGTKLGDIIFKIGGGIPKGKTFKAAQTGGPSGGCIPREYLNEPVDYDNLTRLGAIMGSGGLIVTDEDTCMVDTARFFLEFTQDESCGKCVPCRLGTKRMLEILERITRGEGEMKDIDRLISLGNAIKESAICGLGQTAPNPVLSILRYFREEYEEHIKYKKCKAGVCSDLFISPCENACPASVNVPGYLTLIAQGRSKDAYRLIRQENPFPAICGRICTHPCEAKCRRAQLDEPIAICDLKRFAADYAFKHETDIADDIVFPKKDVSVGIIGAGPSGLTCGYYLARLGYDVHVYEAESVAGGVLAFGIPGYRLPKDVLDHEIKLIEKEGVQIHLNTKIGVNVTLAGLREKHKAVYIATGTQISNRLDIPGEDLEGVCHGLDYLRKVNLGLDAPFGKVVAVIGGGNTAIDAARVARRRGAEKVYIVYRRTIEDMPADRREIEEAVEEGIEIIPLTAPICFLGEQKVKGVLCNRMELREFDASGRRKPKEKADDQATIGADLVIAAVSQSSDLSFIAKGEVELTAWDTFVVNNDTLETSVPGIFAGGDAARGSDTAIQGIADGKKAAQNIAIYLGDTGELNKGRSVDIPQAPVDGDEITEHGRFTMEMLPAEQRIKKFDEVAQGYHKLGAMAESMRCLHCDRR